MGGTLELLQFLPLKTHPVYVCDKNNLIGCAEWVYYILLFYSFGAGEFFCLFELP